MMFDKLCVEKILKGEKTVTRRVKRNKRRPAIPGHVHKLKVDRTDKNYGYIMIKSCNAEPWTGSTSPISYPEAIKEGFDSPFEFWKYWSDVNFKYTDEVWRVEFELIMSTPLGQRLIQ